jgi:hypothetical protein
MIFVYEFIVAVTLGYKCTRLGFQIRGTKSGSTLTGQENDTPTAPTPDIRAIAEGRRSIVYRDGGCHLDTNRMTVLMLLAVAEQPWDEANQI